MSVPHITITLENSKSEIKPKDEQRLIKMSNEINFSKILEYKVDYNYKVSYLIANSLNWQIDFNQSTRQIVLIPIKSEQDFRIEEEEKLRMEKLM